MMWKWKALEVEMEKQAAKGGSRLRDGNGREEKEYDA